jgi:acyl-CoA thioesterase FadM
MYPYLRLAKVVICASLGKRQELGNLATLRMLVWPSDIDFYPEMNNGRHLTLMDLGRIDLAVRTGLFRLVHSNGWGFVAAGASVRFRHPLRPLRFFELRTQTLGQDGRWFYFLQETVQSGKTCSSVLLRGGIRGKRGLVPAREILAALEMSEWNPELPNWVRKWIEADDLRVMGTGGGSHDRVE